MSGDEPGTKELDVYNSVEERLDEIEGRVSEIEEKVSNSFQTYLQYIKHVIGIVYHDIIIQNELSRLDVLKSGEIHLFKNIVNQIQRKRDLVNEVKALDMDTVRILSRNQIRHILELSRKWDVSFEDTASYLIGNLGKEESKQLMDKADILNYYDKDAVTFWESLLKEKK